MVNQQNYPNRTIWHIEGDEPVVQIIDQRWLPHELRIANLKTVDEVSIAISEMWVRGAPLIGATAAWGMYLAAFNLKNYHPSEFDSTINKAAEKLNRARPTAVNLQWAINNQLSNMKRFSSVNEKIEAAKNKAAVITEESVTRCKSIGVNGVTLLKELSQNKNGAPVNILTHCNAGWLACVEWGTATAPIYLAHKYKIPVHVWVDETRPRNQGARLTAWELGQANIPHTIIADNVGGHLMQHGMVDICIVGTDRTTRKGDVANKIGTYLKALAAKDNDIPFYVALPSSTIDWEMENGLEEIPIEIRNEEEVRKIKGKSGNSIEEILIVPEKSKAINYAFDITPHHLITGFITERGICKASEESLKKLFDK